MKYEKEYIEGLLKKFLEGLTTEEEEQMLQDFFCTTEDIPASWQMYKDLFLSFETDAYKFNEGEIDAMLTPVVIEKKTRGVHLWKWAVAACAAFAVIYNSVKAIPAEDTQQATISTSELLEAIDLLADIGAEDVTVSVSQQESGFIVNTESTDGQENSYKLSHCSDESPIEFTSQIINF